MGRNGQWKTNTNNTKASGREVLSLFIIFLGAVILHSFFPVNCLFLPMDKTDYIKREIPRWYQKNKRELPWRRTKDPYKIWLSEIILQQTQVKQALPYYHKILRAFPDVEHLAKADENDLLLLWQGLGYYSRARNMHAAASYIFRDLKGTFPDNYNDLLKLKGVGSYTAAAVASIAYEEPVPAIDGNLIRVLSRVFVVTEPADKSSGLKKIRLAAEKLIPENSPGDFNQAFMDLGFEICKKAKPLCDECPLVFVCDAFAQNITGELPVKAGRVKKERIFMNYFMIRESAEVSPAYILKKRDRPGIWQNLYDFPALEYKRKPSVAKISVDFAEKFGLMIKNRQFMEVGDERKHILSHRDLLIRFFLLVLPKDPFDRLLNYADNHVSVKSGDFINYPFPGIINKFFEEEGKSLF